MVSYQLWKLFNFVNTQHEEYFYVWTRRNCVLKYSIYVNENVYYILKLLFYKGGKGYTIIDHCDGDSFLGTTVLKKK
jgi:hypothetical protein